MTAKETEKKDEAGAKKPTAKKSAAKTEEKKPAAKKAATKAEEKKAEAKKTAKKEKTEE